MSNQFRLIKSSFFKASFRKRERKNNKVFCFKTERFEVVNNKRGDNFGSKRNFAEFESVNEATNGRKMKIGSSTQNKFFVKMANETIVGKTGAAGGTKKRRMSNDGIKTSGADIFFFFRGGEKFLARKTKRRKEEIKKKIFCFRKKSKHCIIKE